uniref:Uncharacterized protein n=1 Tax=Zea mays TaxID=4577 RepID=B7ZYD7_MAIZE|nr:unknown [Zea mays]|eukprot:XP_020401179.1 uncharacterized protein LOC100279486 [Zea mays]
MRCFLSRQVLPAVWARGSLVGGREATHASTSPNWRGHTTPHHSSVQPLPLSSPLLPKQEQRDARARATSWWNLAASRGRSRAEPWFRREIRARRPPLAASVPVRLPPFFPQPARSSNAAWEDPCFSSSSSSLTLVPVAIPFDLRHAAANLSFTKRKFSLSLSLSGCHLCVDSRERRWNGITAGGEIAFWCARSWR